VRGCFVTATDTGVGKTVVAAAIVAALRAQGRSVAAFKPVVTGTNETVDPDWPPDDELLARAAGARAAEVTPAHFGPPASPHLAAELAGTRLDPERIVAHARRASATADTLVVEGVGGLLVPLTPEYLIRDFARELALPLIVAARPALGTINHTLLTLQAARLAGLTVASVVLTPWPAQPSAIEQDNRETIERLGEVEVATLDRIDRGEPELLAAIGTTLPLERWLG
jgi:dethiobiotin synthetase